MAIFHMNFSNISSGKMRSAVASASYRSGQVLYSEKEQKKYYYSREVLPESLILVPKNAPYWARNRERLWNEVEKIDRRANSRYAKEFNVALPIELTADEQKELLIKYVQENFVDIGMVADIAIHRDHPHNPHAHVMLTNRPFNADGTWGKKSKTEYILDKNGNKIYTKNGNIRQRKIWLVDWDKREKINEWRSAWANAVNLTFEEKNMPYRISEKSFEEQGLDELPTKHEGVNSLREERKKYNDDVKSLRKNKADYSNTIEKISNIEKIEAIKKHTSFKEKAILSQLSKQLHMYIDLESLEDKKRMLFNWKNSLLIKNISDDEFKEKINIINNQELSLKEADEVLNTIVKRCIKDFYGQNLAEKLTMAEQRQLIKETENENCIFKGKDLEEKVYLIRADIINQQILSFTKRPFVSIKNMNLRDENIKKKIDKILSKRGQSIEDLDTQDDLKLYSEQDKTLIKSGLATLKINQKIREIVLSEYEQVIIKSFPDCNINTLKTSEKERIYNALVYFNPGKKELSKLTINDWIENPPVMFTSKDHKQGLAYFNNYLPIEKIENVHLRNILKNKGAVKFFFDECSQDKNINSKDLKRAKMIEKAESEKNEDYRKEKLNIYDGLSYREESRKNNLSRLFTQIMFDLLYNKDLSKERVRLSKEKELDRAMQKRYFGNKKEKDLGLHK